MPPSTANVGKSHGTSARTASWPVPVTIATV
jgi:hypothetical protein